MSKEEEKKGISVVGTFKRTDLKSGKPNDEIGVEADIPIEEERGGDDLNISTSELRLNTGGVREREGERPRPAKAEAVPSEIDLNEKKVKVFDMSSGRVVEKDVVRMVSNSQSTIKEEIKRQAIDLPTVDAQRKAQSDIKTSEGSRFPTRMWLILAAALILLILLFYLILYNEGDSQVGQTGSSPSTINLSK